MRPSVFITQAQHSRECEERKGMEWRIRARNVGKESDVKANENEERENTQKKEKKMQHRERKDGFK